MSIGPHFEQLLALGMTPAPKKDDFIEADAGQAIGTVDQGQHGGSFFLALRSPSFQNQSQAVSANSFAAA